MASLINNNAIKNFWLTSYSGYYLGHSKLSTAYGSAGSAIVMLAWVYYSSMILYFGAVFTHVFAKHSGSQIYPTDYAVSIQEIEVESKYSIQQQPESKTVIEVIEKPNEK